MLEAGVLMSAESEFAEEYEVFGLFIKEEEVLQERVPV